MKKINWLVVSIIGVIVLLFLFGAGAMAGRWGYGGYGMMGDYGGHMGWGLVPFGWFGMGFGMLFMWLIPVGLIALAIYGVVALTRNATPPPAALAACPNCGKGTQADWQNCPHCGTALK